MNPDDHADAVRARVLLLDVDGVLVIPPSMFNAALSRQHPELLRDFFVGPFIQASTGKADLRELLLPLLKQTGHTSTPDEYMAEWFAAENVPNLPLLEAVRHLRAAGWASYLATNQEAYRLRYLLHDMELNEVVDGEFASCSVGVRKPSPGYFEQVTAALTVRHLGLSPAEIVFWDDAGENVEAALKAGWTAHLYTDLAGFQAVISGLD